MAVLKIFNDIQTENEKNYSKFFGDVEGICYKDVDEFCEQIPEDDNKIDVRLHCNGGLVQKVGLFTTAYVPLVRR